MAVSAGPAVPPRSVFPFRVRCGFRRSLVLGSWLLTVCGPSRRRPFRVEQSRREPGCRPVGLRRNGAAFAPSPPVLARESSPACGFSTGSVDGQTARPSGEAIGAERRRVENSRRRPSAAASTQASYGSGAARLAAVLERDALGRRLLFITCTFRLLAPSVRPPRVGRRCRRTTVPAACSDSGTRSRPRPLGDWTVPKSNSLMTVRPSGNPCSTSAGFRVPLPPEYLLRLQRLTAWPGVAVVAPFCAGLALPVPHNFSLDFMQPLRYGGRHGDSESGLAYSTGQPRPPARRAGRGGFAGRRQPRAGR